MSGRRAALVGALLGCALTAVGVGAGLFLSARSGAPPTLPAVVSAPQETHLPFGPIRPPRAMPAVALTGDDGVATTLAALTHGRYTLLQLMFTGCSVTCPIQGAIFKAVQAALAAEGVEAQLLSVSIDAVGDTPDALARWLSGFDARTGWRAVVPSPEGVGPLVDALNGRGSGPDVHDARVYLLAPSGKLIFVTEEMPSPRYLVKLLRDAAAFEARAPR
ncbi:SCO family protein [Methylopila sp. 73B]|uniref:SCO family protein n=1 Tax=Methylopila sp. 73B TaxID=1120792 RepID=UPI00036C326F|nr:SCO family protein [Methylopila sp. 73B]